MSVFLLDQATGRILRRVGEPVATSTKGAAGSTSNAVVAAPWSDEFVALSDVPGGYVEVWRLAGKEEVTRVARVEVGEGCCANAVWFD